MIARSGLLFGAHGPPDRLRLFVATRAVLGVVRALVDEADAGDLPDGALEAELLRMIESYLWPE
jgi:hypothetical protein